MTLHFLTIANGFGCFKKVRQPYKRLYKLILLSAVLSVLSSAVWAHQASTAYLKIEQDLQQATQYRVSYELALRDLLLLEALDQNNDLKVTWSELQAQQAALQQLMQTQIVFNTASDGACKAIAQQDLWLNTHAGETYVLLRSVYQCPAKMAQLDYRVLSEVDNAHRVILTLQTVKPAAPSGHHHHGDDTDHLHAQDHQASHGHTLQQHHAQLKHAPHSHVQHAHTHENHPVKDALFVDQALMQPERYNVKSLPLAPGIHTLDDAALPWWNYIYAGMHHLLIGWDHLLFLFSLVVAAVYRPINATGRIQLQPVDGALQTLKRTFWLATTFTVAHSITLSLAALELLSLPSRLIESIIALSIAIIALNNLKPLFWQGLLPITFAFGLIHGFGFANVIVDLPVSTLDKALALFLFNLGIELGQILCIALALPIAFYWRKTAVYKHVVFQGGSVIALLMGLYWFAQRTFEL